MIRAALIVAMLRTAFIIGVGGCPSVAGAGGRLSLGIPLKPRQSIRRGFFVLAVPRSDAKPNSGRANYSQLPP